MPTGQGIEVEGLAQLQRALEKLQESAADDLKALGLAAGQPVLEAARETVPVVTGELQSSIRLVKSSRGVKVRAGSARVPYAKPIHFGWQSHNIIANKFLFRAVDRTVDQVADIYLNGVIDIWNRNL